MEEPQHIITILQETKHALNEGNSLRLKELSNQTIHSASVIQDAGSLTLAVIVYTLSKFIERGDDKKVKHWHKFVKKINSFLDLAILSLKQNNESNYQKYLENIRKSFSSMPINVHSYIQEVLRKAAINKASKIYEHGISMGQTAKLLGISQWELLEYSGQKAFDLHLNEDSITVKKRAEIALDFLS